MRTLSFDKAMHSVEFEQNVAMAADDMPTKALVNIQGSFPTGSTLQVWICNNGNDAEPTWEDITTCLLYTSGEAAEVGVAATDDGRPVVGDGAHGAGGVGALGPGRVVCLDAVQHARPSVGDGVGVCLLYTSRCV